jgi:tetratricopeptide (TPR) repeat protein
VTEEDRVTPINEESYEDHPLYLAAMRVLDYGDAADAAAKLRELVKEYPDEQRLRDVLVRTELRASLGDSKPAPVVRRAPAPALGRVVLALLVVTICMIALAGFAAAYRQFVIIPNLDRQQDQKIESLREEVQARMAAGDWSGARETLAALLTEVRGDSEAEAALALIDQLEALDQQYVDAVAAQQQGDTATALTIFRQIEAQSPGYRDVRQRIESLEELENLEALWQQSEGLIGAGDWNGAINLLTQIRAKDPSFRGDQVKERLYQVYAQVARELIAGANGSVDTLRQAVVNLNKALALDPGDRNLVQERDLTEDFVDGADAFAQEHWAEAVALWEDVYTAQPGFQNGILPGYLNQAYPQAATELLARAKGNVSQLTLASRYLDRAVAARPGDQTLVDERQLVNDYLAGSEAYAQSNWDAAIVRWGAVYTVRPGYQDGVLRERLRDACEKSSSPDQTICQP